jgi:lipoteichoic acid synthase
MQMKEMPKKIKEFARGIPHFLKVNVFVIITGFLIVLKLYFFNENFNLINERLVMLVVSTVIVFSFLSYTVFFPKKRIKYATGWNILFSALILTDTIYIRYFDSLPSVQSIFYADSVFGVMDSVRGLFKIQDIFLFIDIPILLFAFKRFRGAGINYFEESSGKIYNYCFIGFCLFCLLFVTIFDMKNVKLLTTKVYDNRVTAERYSVTGYHLLDLYRFANNQLTRLSEKEKEEAIKEAKKYIPEKSKNEMTGIAKNKNVIIIQFESLQNFVINKKIDGQEITPNINKFVNENDYFTNNYFQLGFGGTADSDFVANTSLYPLRSASTFVQYGQNDYQGLADNLKESGYSTNAYHGFSRSFWNRNVALKSLGYDKFLGSESYSNYSKINMGVNDEDFLKETVNQIKDQKKPSMSYVITLTSHFPFGLPYNLKGLNITSGTADTVSNYYQAIHYSDKAFGEFIQRLKEEGLYDDSLIILYGDHYANIGEVGKEDIFKSIGFKKPLSLKESTELKKVPLVIHRPGATKGAVIDVISSHLDITPTILNMLSVDSKKPYFGRDLYGIDREPFFAAVLYFGGGFVENSNHVYFDGSVEGLENGTCYRIFKKEWQPTDVKECKPLVEKRDKETSLSEKLIKYNLLRDVN